MRGPILLLLPLVLATACPPMTPPASVDDLTRLQQRIDGLQKRLTAIEPTVAQSARISEETDRANRQSRADQAVLIEDLRNEIKTLRGQMEVLSYDLKQASDAQKKFREDTDVRLSELEQRPRASAAPVPTGSGGTTTRNPAAKGGNDITEYNRILRIYMDKKDYAAAIAQFEGFLRDFPDSRYSANAQYWIAEGHYAQGDYARAITEFQKVIEGYPKSDKVCDSTLKQGYAFAELRDLKQAKLFLTDVKERCKGTPAASKAARRLTDLAASEPKK